MRLHWPLVLIVLSLALLVRCTSQSSQPTTAKPTPKPTETLTGREAIQKLYVQARGWAPDAAPVRLESTATSDSDGHGGKSAIWRCSFASPSRSAIKPYIWSGEAKGSAERGVSPGTEDNWNPGNSSQRQFEFGYLNTDSEQAWKVAQAHGGEKKLQSDPKLPVQYTLDWDPVRKNLVWHVVYGASRDSAVLRVAVNAYDGSFLRVEK